MFMNSFIHKIFSEFLQPFRYVGMTRVAPFLIVVFVFLGVLAFWLAWSTGRPALSVQHVNLTQMLDRNLSHTCMSAFAPFSLSLDTVIVGGGR